MVAQPEGWHLDKRVPIALIAAIVMQTVSAIWWASAITARVDSLERIVTASAPASASRETRLVRVETQVQGIREGLDDIKETLLEMNRKLDRAVTGQ